MIKYLFLIVVIVGFYGLERDVDPDLFARMAVGKLVLDSGSVPLQDPFAFTFKKALWIDHEWLSGVAFYALQQIAGENFLLLANILLACVTLLILYFSHKISVAPDRILLFLACIVESRYVWSSPIRSQVFTYLFCAVFLLILKQVYQTSRTRWLWFFPFLMLLWANLHGGFVVGLGLLWLFTIGSSFEKRAYSGRLWIVSWLCLLATAVNPYGFFEYWSYILDAVTMRRPDIQEWAPLSLISERALFPLVITVFAILGWLRSSSRKLITGPNLMLLGSLVYGCQHSRLLAIYLFVFYVFATDYFDTGLRILPEQFRNLWVDTCLRLKWLVIGIALFSIFRLAFISDARKFSYANFPKESVEFLANNGSGRLLVGFNWGSYALWHLYPNYLVSMDGRYEEVYPEETFHMNMLALNPVLPESKSALIKINPDYILAEKKKLQGGASFGVEWEKLFEDSVSVLYRRSPQP